MKNDDYSGPCWICQRNADLWDDPRNESTTFTCRVCGFFRVPANVPPPSEDDARLLPYLAAHIRQSRPAGRIDITRDWIEAAQTHADNSIAQRLRLLLELIARRSKVGQEIKDEIELLAPLIDARDVDEARFLLRHLEAVGYIRLGIETLPSHDRAPSASGERASILMRVAGWEAVSPVAGAGIVGTCFIAMSFDPSLNDAYENGMVAAIEKDCGFKVIRTDREEFNDDITDRILAGIRTAEFVVADFTRQSAGVYFEAGFAKGLGREVIWTCHVDDVKTLHFDTRQRNHIRWNAPQDLRRQLTDRIRGTVGLAARLAAS